MTTEKTIETKLRLGIESLGGLCIKIPATFFAGIPDRLCLLPGGQAFFVETKATGLKPRPRQTFVKKQLEALGFTVYVVNSLEGVTALLDVYRPSGLTATEETVLYALEQMRKAVKERYPGDDLSDEDLAEMLRLYNKKLGYANP
jgi:hypothetical protein